MAETMQGLPEGGAGTPPSAEPPSDSGPDPRRGLLAWLAIVAGGGLACVLLGHADGGVFFALAGVFALAQASDAAVARAGFRAWVHERLPDRQWPGTLFRLAVRSIVPGMGAAFYAAIAIYAVEMGHDAAHRVAAAWCALAALASLALAARPVADRLTAVFFRTGPIGRTRRLTARLVLLGLLMPVPLRLLAGDLMGSFRTAGAAVADPGALLAMLAGEVAVALAGVGLFVRRGPRDARVRLGLTAVRPAHLVLVVAGVVGAFVLNAGMEWIERHAFHSLWVQDSEMTSLIAANLPAAVSILLGVCAGAGEELCVRGALQPRLGIGLSSLLFACGHVQYTWFGMLTVGLLGVLLGFVRSRANTSTAVAVHAVYDMLAALTAGR